MGKFYKTTEEFQKIFTELAEKLLIETKENSRLKTYSKVLAFNFTDHDIKFTIDLTNSEKNIIIGETDKDAEIKIWMSTDSAHRMLLGKLNPISAVMSREIRVSGPFQALPNVVKLFSAANRIYRDVLTENGLEDLIQK